MKKLILFLAVILGSLLMQSCLCDCWLFEPVHHIITGQELLSGK